MHKLPRIAALTLGLWAAEARADDVRGTRSEKLIEERHEASLVVNPGWANLVVRRTVHNGGERHDQAVFWIEVPEGGVAVGLRTLGELEGRPHWFAGELMEAEQAAERYRELTGIGGYYPKDPALLSWRGQNQLALQVFPVAPSSPKTIEYTYIFPTEYRGGAHHLVLPYMGTEKLSASLRARPGIGVGKLELDGERLASNAPIRVEPQTVADFALVAKRAPLVGGALAVVPFAEGRVLTRYRVEAAPRLAPLPRAARVVVVLDGSRSISDKNREAQVALARAYLSHLPDAKVEVLMFDREVRPRHGRFVGAKAALRDLETMKLAGRNGSEVESALLQAEALLEKQGPQHPKRILLVTDTRTREALTPDRLRGSVGKSGALVHLALVDEGMAQLDRVDDHEWTVVTRPTGGLVWQARASVDATAAANNRTVHEELVRPVRIHHLQLSAPRIPSHEIIFEETLSEGEGVTHTWIATEATPWLKVEGELWAEPIRARFEPDVEEGTRWSALVFGSDVMHGLDDKEMMTLAMRGRAVSPVTSYLAIEPGVRPSTEGLEDSFGVGGLAMSGSGRGGGGVGSASLDNTTRIAWLRRELSARWKRCGGKRSTTLAVETTVIEVVEVASKLDGERPDESAASSCVRQAVWELALPPDFAWVSWNRWVVPLVPS